MALMLPELLHAELKELSAVYKLSMAEILRAGAVIMTDRYHRYKENENKPRPNIDKTLNNN